jgi:hypothetical protein
VSVEGSPAAVEDRAHALHQLLDSVRIR